MPRILEPGQIEAFAQRAIPEIRLPERTGPFAARAARLAQLAQIAVAGENNALFRRQCRMPRRVASDRADSFDQFIVVHRRRVRIKPGELVKLDDGAAHDKAAPRVALRFFLLPKRHWNYRTPRDARVAELVDAHDSKSCSARSGGSIPSTGTTTVYHGCSPFPVMD